MLTPREILAAALAFADGSTVVIFGLSLSVPIVGIVLACGFFVACAVLVWLLSMFRGWGILFFGGLVQLVVLFALAAFLLHALFVRAFRSDAG